VVDICRYSCLFKSVMIDDEDDGELVRVVDEYLFVGRDDWLYIFMHYIMVS